jgi:hypothetical protein
VPVCTSSAVFPVASSMHSVLEEVTRCSIALASSCAGKHSQMQDTAGGRGCSLHANRMLKVVQRWPALFGSSKHVKVHAQQMHVLGMACDLQSGACLGGLVECTAHVHFPMQFHQCQMLSECLCGALYGQKRRPEPECGVTVNSAGYSSY